MERKIIIKHLPEDHEKRKVAKIILVDSSHRAF